ncbi:hypothetical protein [Salinilacihabitans rarus]|uniref:hypothetical protein n=1 Tax=Salinilacihabitans rarus TaxID=2961596 RepID=UPI0020C8E002|nr:hypothetical protein [Salinilacihabitans rarus]
MSRLARFGELRRALPLTAAALLLVSLALPVWRITLTAPQYVETLVVELYAYPRLAGDFVEVQRLNHYVGFYYPDPVYVEPNYEVNERAVAVPEWVLGPVLFVALAAGAVVSALAPSARALARRLRYQLAGTVALFAATGAIIQYRLYQTGHSLDPAAPLSGVDGFTPPLVGTYEVANISGNAWLGPGGYLAALAVALLAVAYLLRESEATVGDLPDLLRAAPDRVRERVGRNRDERDERGRRERPGADSPDATERGRGGARGGPP